MKLFEGRTAMVTGAGRNIGKEIAHSFARNGANVIVCDYNEENALATTKEVVDRVWPKIEGGGIRPSIYQVLPVEKAEEAHGILERSENIGKVVLKVL